MRRNVLMVIATCAVMVLVAQLVLPTPNLRAQGTSPCAKTGFAFVSSTAILSSIPEWLAADSLVQKDKAAYTTELAKQQGALDSAARVYQDKSTLYNQAQKAAEIKKLEGQRDQLSAHASELDGKMTARSNELFQPITLRVQAVLDGMRAELNCVVIFDVMGGNGGLGIASADKTVDLTDRVVARLKAAGGDIEAHRDRHSRHQAGREAARQVVAGAVLPDPGDSLI